MACCTLKNCNLPAICGTNGNNCEKVCIDAKKVFDACMQQKNISATLTVDFGTESAANIISVTSSGDATVTNPVITPIAGSCASRVTFTLSIPLSVSATNATGSVITGTSTLTVDQDILLRVPQEGVIAPAVSATAVLNGLQNTVTGGNTVTTNACVTVISKIVADVILVIPSYGYLLIPPCQEYTQEICGSVFNTPLFPR